MDTTIPIPIIIKTPKRLDPGAGSRVYNEFL
jgi:hypothetical protein